ncbi:MAG: CC_3452 family protein [Erythrobacter sp.]
MNITLPASRRLAILASALVYTGLSFGIATSATPLHAAGGGYYTATLTAPADAKGQVLGGVAWNCQGNTCVAAKGDARPLRICRGLARKFGEVASFKANGEELPAEELAKCNGQ